MSFLAANMEKRSVNLQDPQQLKDLGILRPTTSGLYVSQESALTYTAVFACIRLLSETIASLPLLVYLRGNEGTKSRAESHWLYKLLHDQPNPFLNSFEYRRLAMVHLTSWGNHYSEIELGPNNQIKALWPLVPGNMEKIERKGGGLIYHYRMPDHTIEQIPGYKLLHIRGLGSNGYFGLSPIALFRQAIGLGLAAENFGSAFFGNGAQLGGVFTHPGVLSQEAYDRLNTSIKEKWGGISNVGRTAILEEGMQYARVGIPPEDAQFLETRKFQVNEVSRIYGVQPHMIGDLERATFSNVEEQSINFARHTITPWVVGLESAMRSQLLTSREQDQLLIEFLLEGLQRGDTASRYGSYAIARQWGWMSANDIRRLENQNPIAGGDQYLTPLNMIPASGDAAPGQPEKAPPENQNSRSLALSNGREIRSSQKRAAAARHNLQGIYVGLFADVYGRIVRREANDIGNQIKKQQRERSLAGFTEWLEGFYIDHADFVARQLAPTEAAYARQVLELVARELDAAESPTIDNFVDAYIARTAGRMTTKSRDRLQAVLESALADDTDPYDALLGELDNWRESRPESLARDESVRANNAYSLAGYGALGVIIKTWVSFGDSCPYCTSLNGRTIALNDNFISAGQPFRPAGAAAPLTSGGNIGHAPAHNGCDCMVVSGV